MLDGKTHFRALSCLRMRHRLYALNPKAALIIVPTQGLFHDALYLNVLGSR